MRETDELEAIRERKRRELVERAGGEEDAGGAVPSTGAPAEPVHVGSRAAFESFTAAHSVVLVDFYADWCGPCQLLDPIVREIARDTAAAVAKVDVDELAGLARERRIQGVPTLFLYVDGEPRERLVGVQDYGTLEALIEPYVAGHAG